MDKNQENEVVLEGGNMLKCWSAPKLTDADIAALTEFGLDPGLDGSASVSTLS